MGKELAIEWLKAAKPDLDNIVYIVNDKSLTTIVAFHSQQAVEKTLKSLLVYDSTDVPKIHSLNKLFKMVDKYLSVENVKIIDDLDSIYIESRYPGEIGLMPAGRPTIEEAKEFYNFALKIFDKVCTIIGVDKKEFE